VYAGRRVECPCCETRLAEFRVPDPARLNAVCPWCGSHIRHRNLWLYLRERTDLLGAPARVLHVAPEYVLQERLRSLPQLDYLSADLESPLAMAHFDITAIPFEDDSFDVVLCSHVLEHVPDDRRAMRELRRVLRPSGWGVIQVPVDYTRTETLEDPAIVSPDERERVYWQSDHLRLYGQDFPRRLEEEGFRVTVDRWLHELPREVVERHGLYSLEDMYLVRS
jgi:SAM-dependent methyltransferase